MKLYNNDGYFDFPKIADFAEKHNIAFIYVIGGRGTGKTYGAVDAAIKQHKKFMWLRRLQSQVDIINKPEFNPFKANAESLGFLPIMKPISKYNAAIYESEPDGEGGLIPTGEPLGYTGALSTFSNMRGFDASEIVWGIWDEFIPESHERPIKYEAEAFFNAYETINRNRELKGQKPLIFFLLANSNDIGNPIFLYKGHVKKCLEMRQKGHETYINEQQGYMIIMLDNSPISRKKADTALYRYTAGSAFNEMSLNNIFSGESDIKTASRPIKEYTPVVSVGELTIYRHKGNQLPHYVSFHKSGQPVQYGAGETELERFQRKYTYLWIAYLDDRLEFEDYGAELLFQRYFK